MSNRTTGNLDFKRHLAHQITEQITTSQLVGDEESERGCEDGEGHQEKTEEEVAGERRPVYVDLMNWVVATHSAVISSIIPTPPRN